MNQVIYFVVVVLQTTKSKQHLLLIKITILHIRGIPIIVIFSDFNAKMFVFLPIEIKSPAIIQ